MTNKLDILNLEQNFACDNCSNEANIFFKLKKSITCNCGYIVCLAGEELSLCKLDCNKNTYGWYLTDYEFKKEKDIIIIKAIYALEDECSGCGHPCLLDGVFITKMNKDNFHDLCIKKNYDNKK